jgi:hypothetical protein
MVIRAFATIVIGGERCFCLDERLKASLLEEEEG